MGTMLRPSGSEVPRVGGRRARQNIDANRRGQRGDHQGAAEVQLLLSEASAITLQDSPLNTAAASQLQRIRTSARRASWERRRATPNPSDDEFLASGRGTHRERRPLVRWDPTEGAIGQNASQRGSRWTVAARAGRSSISSAARGAEDQRPTAGIRDGRGTYESRAANAAFGRPHLDEGPAATEGDPGRVQDNRDAELLAAQLLQSVADSTRRSGRDVGDGIGGVGGGGAPGVGGGEGAGGLAQPFGSLGEGQLDEDDARYVRWYLAQRRRIEDRLQFPIRRQLEMDQGRAVYELVVRRDGTLVGAPSRIRSSGYPDLDAAALTAIRTSAPFAPLPPELAPGSRSIRINMSVAFSNPMVR